MAKKTYLYLLLKFLPKNVSIISTSTIDSEFLKNSGVKFYELEPAVNTEKFQKNPRNPIKNSFLYFGRIDKNKGIEKLINSMASILSNDPESQLILAGKINKDFEKIITSIVKSKLYSEKIHFLGNVDDSTLSKLLSRAEFIVIPSEFESIGFTFFEAAAAGSTIIANNIQAFTKVASGCSFVSFVDFNNSLKLENLVFHMRKNYIPDNREGRRWASQFDSGKSLKKFLTYVVDDKTNSSV